MGIVFLITTYNRQESCQRLVDGLQGLGDIIVVNDGSDYSIDGAVNINPNIHLGKAGYWKLVNLLFRSRTPASYYFMLPDDFLICDSQIAKAIEIWGSINDKNKVCLNLYTDRQEKSCWTGLRPIDKGNIWQTGWVDMCFLCEEKFFKTIGTIPRLHKPRRGRIRGSSGVGAYISKYLHKKKMNMYQVKESLVDVQEEHNDSQMHKRC